MLCRFLPKFWRRVTLTVPWRSLYDAMRKAMVDPLPAYEGTQCLMPFQSYSGQAFLICDGQGICQCPAVHDDINTLIDLLAEYSALRTFEC